MSDTSHTITDVRTAFLVIDVQRGLFDAPPRPADADAVIQRINSLASRARAAGVPVIFIQHEEEDESLRFGSTGWELERQLAVEPGDHRIRKTTPDSFLRTGLGDLLAARGINHVVVCGYASEFCVDTTVRRAAANGLTVTLASDAHTTHDKPHARADQIRLHHNATLSDIASFGPPIRAVATADIRFVG